MHMLGTLVSISRSLRTREIARFACAERIATASAMPTMQTPAAFMGIRRLQSLQAIWPCPHQGKAALPQKGGRAS